MIVFHQLSLHRCTTPPPPFLREKNKQTNNQSSEPLTQSNKTMEFKKKKKTTVQFTGMEKTFYTQAFDSRCVTRDAGYELPAIYRDVLSRDSQYKSRDKTPKSII